MKKGEPVPYPTAAELQAEDAEEAPSVILTITDDQGNLVRRLRGPAAKGIQRMTWDLRFASITPTKLSEPEEDDPFSEGDKGRLAMPGKYAVSLAKRVDGVETTLAGPVAFSAVVLGTVSLPAEDRGALTAFQSKVADLQRAVQGASRAAEDAKTLIAHLKKAIVATPRASATAARDLGMLEKRLRDIQRALNGDNVLRSRNEPVPPSITERVNGIVEDQWQSTSAPTQTQIRSYETATDEFAPQLEALRTLVETDLRNFAMSLERAGAPWTPGHVPEWSRTK